MPHAVLAALLAAGAHAAAAGCGEHHNNDGPAMQGMPVNATDPCDCEETCTQAGAAGWTFVNASAAGVVKHVCYCRATWGKTQNNCDCWSGQVATPAPATPQPATPPAPAGYNFTQALNTAGTLQLSWNYNAAAGSVDFKATAAVPAGTAPGYLAIGFSPDGLMHNGDYIIGYSHCVVARTNNATKGNPPNGPAAFALSGTSFVAANGVWTLTASRPLAGGNAIVGTAQKVIFAAGSQGVTPWHPANISCGDVEFAAGNHHDLGGDGFVGSADVAFASGPPSSPAPAPPPAPPATPQPATPPAPAGYSFTQGLNTAGTLQLSWNYNAAAGSVDFQATATVPAGTVPGYLAIGFSPDGLMHKGDYIIGYSRCVVARTNNATKGNPPNGPGAYALNGTSFVTENGVWTLTASRPLAGGNAIVGTAQKVIFAAGSQAVTPWHPANESCADAQFAAGNHHDLGGDGFVGSADVAFASGPASSPAPTPPPAPPATPQPATPTPAPPGADKYVCTVCQHVYDAAKDGGGKAFADLPDTWVCPVCGAPKSAYTKQVVSGRWGH